MTSYAAFWTWRLQKRRKNKTGTYHLPSCELWNVYWHVGWRWHCAVQRTTPSSFISKSSRIFNQWPFTPSATEVFPSIIDIVRKNYISNVIYKRWASTRSPQPHLIPSPRFLESPTSKSSFAMGISRGRVSFLFRETTALCLRYYAPYIYWYTDKKPDGWSTWSSTMIWIIGRYPVCQSVFTSEDRIVRPFPFLPIFRDTLTHVTVSTVASSSVVHLTCWHSSLSLGFPINFERIAFAFWSPATSVVVSGLHMGFVSINLTPMYIPVRFAFFRSLTHL